MFAIFFKNEYYILDVFDLKNNGIYEEDYEYITEQIICEEFSNEEE